MALLLPSIACAQDHGTGENTLQEGMSLYRDGKYADAVLVFRQVVMDSRPLAVRPDAYFWLAKSYMAANSLSEAERSLEHFLNSYPSHPDAAEANYLKGRLLFLQGEKESAIQVFQSFLDKYSGSDLAANALFWIGESLYELGHLEEASALFNRVVKEYPASYKVEAAGYRVSLIEFKKRENELLKLLKWSHEETLRTIEEFQKREKSYEQAIAVYQRRLSGMQPGEKAAVEPGPGMERLKSENAQLKSRVEQLEKELASGSGETDNRLREELERKMKLLELKEEALAVKERLLESTPSPQP